MDLPKILKNDSSLFDDYKEIIINRVKHGPNIYKKYLNLDDKYHCLLKAQIEMHLMDPSTGTLREFAALWLSNAEPVSGQHGYDGQRGDIPIECKPNLWTPRKLKSLRKQNVRGSGSINDHTFGRHEKYINEGLIMQTSQFFDGICGWIIEFPYTYDKFTQHMEKQLDKPSGRVCGRFTYLNYFDCPDIQIHYINRRLIKKYKNDIVGGKRNEKFFKWLMN